MAPRPSPCHHRPVTTRPFQLQTVTIGDDAAAWADAGFDVAAGDRVTIGNTEVQLVGTSGDRGILSITLDDLHVDIDGMPFAGSDAPAVAAIAHPNISHTNRVTGFDHLVAMSPDMDRTTAALVGAGLEHRRTRTFDAGGSTKRQEFFWLGDVILELAGEDSAHGQGPARLWGLAFTCDDLDTAAASLGDALGAVKPAAQKGRRIATLRTRELDISTPIAFMSPHRPPQGS